MRNFSRPLSVKTDEDFALSVMRRLEVINQTAEKSTAQSDYNTGIMPIRDSSSFLYKKACGYEGINYATSELWILVVPAFLLANAAQVPQNTKIVEGPSRLGRKRGRLRMR